MHEHLCRNNDWVTCCAPGPRGLAHSMLNAAGTVPARTHTQTRTHTNLTCLKHEPPSPNFRDRGGGLQTAALQPARGLACNKTGSKSKLRDWMQGD